VDFVQQFSHIPHIGFAINDTRFVFWALMEQGSRETAQQLKLAIEVNSATTAAEQAEIVQRFVADRVDALIIAPIGEQHPDFVAAIAAAKQAKIPIITCESGYLQPLGFAQCDVRANLLRAAENVTRYLVERLGARGNVLHIAGTNSAPRTEGFNNIVASEPAIQVVQTVEVNWTREGAFQATAAALEAFPELTEIFAHSDEMALGALQALEASGRGGQVLVFGIDGSPEALPAIHQGTRAATVDLAPRHTGQLAVQAIAQILQQTPVPPTIDTPTSLITAANLLAIALNELTVLPQIIRALAESNAVQRRLQEKIITTQRQMIHELSSPIIPISDAILVLPLIGTIDAVRAQHIMESMLAEITRSHTQFLIIDITGVAMVDTNVAHHLLQATQAARLLGTQSLLVGITPEVAQTVIQLGVDLSSLAAFSTLQVGLEYAMRQVAKAS
jgi:ABC-type sugar transport system substrate-binding protein/anti-anti-sigma regulatory factor